MKIVLSRKGFDSEYGGCPSPILPDNTMFSMPIPDLSGNYQYKDLVMPNGKNYFDIWQDLCPRGSHDGYCHLDPDIRNDIKSECPKSWQPAFGQIGSAQTHLKNNNITVGDLFLFFGWFQKTEYCNNHLRYILGSSDIHVIYGYMQIGEILQDEDVKKCSWHPHSDNNYIYKQNGEKSNNTIYVASKNLIINDEDMEMPGSGTFRFSKDIILTAEGMSRSKWKLNEVFGKVPLSYHSDKNIKDGYFQSAKKGQEFVFDEDSRVTEWAKKLFVAQKTL